MWVRMAKCVHGNAAGEIEIALAIGSNQPRAFTALESDIRTRENRQQVSLREGRRRCVAGHNRSDRKDCGRVDDNCAKSNNGP
jgi:hypothetical protein